MEKLVSAGCSSERRISKRLLRKKLMNDLNHEEEYWECPAGGSLVCETSSAQNLQEYDRKNDDSLRKQKGKKTGSFVKKAIKDSGLADNSGIASWEEVAFSEDRVSQKCRDENTMKMRDTTRKHKRRKKNKSSEENIVNKDEIISREQASENSFFEALLGTATNLESHTIVRDKNLAKYCEEPAARKEGSSREHTKSLERGVHKFIKNVERAMASSSFDDLLEPQADMEGRVVVQDTNASQHCEKLDMEKEEYVRKHIDREIARKGKKSIKHGNICNEKRFSSVEKILAGFSFSDLHEKEANFEGDRIVHAVNLAGPFEKQDMESEEILRKHSRRKMQRADKKSTKVDFVGDRKYLSSTGEIASSSSFSDVLAMQADPNGQTIAHNGISPQRSEEHSMKNMDSSRKHNMKKTTRTDKKSKKVDFTSNKKEITSVEQIMANSSFAETHAAPIETEGGTSSHMDSAQQVEEKGKGHKTSSRKHRRNMDMSRSKSDGHTMVDVHDMRLLEEHDTENEGVLKEHRRKKQRGGKDHIEDGNFDCKKERKKVVLIKDGNFDRKKGDTSMKQLSGGSSDAQVLEVESQGESGGCAIIRNTNSVQHHKEHGMEVDDGSRKHRRRKESATMKSLNAHVFDLKNMTTSEERAAVSSSDVDLLQTQASKGQTLFLGAVSTQRNEKHKVEKEKSKKRKRRNKVNTSSSFDCPLGTQGDPGGSCNGYETISTQHLEEHKTKSKHRTRTQDRKKSERACKTAIKGDDTCNLKLLNSAEEAMAISAVSDLHVTHTDAVGGSICHDMNQIQHFEEHDMVSADILRKLRKQKRAIENVIEDNTPCNEAIESADQHIEGMSFCDLLGRQLDLEGCTVVDDAIQDSVRMHRRKKRKRTGEDSFNEDSLSNKTGIATVSQFTASTLTDLAGEGREAEGFIVHGMNSTRHHKHAKEREGSSRKHKRSKMKTVDELPQKDEDLGGKIGTSSREQVTLVVDQISSLTSVDLCQHVDFSQVSKPYIESISGEASRPRFSDSEPCIHSPQGSCEYDYISVPQENSISNKLHHRSKSASLMEAFTPDNDELGGKACEKNSISAHKRSTVEMPTTVDTLSYDNGGVSILENKGTVGAENSAIVPKLSNQDDMESVPFGLPVDSNEVPLTLLRDIDVDSVVVSKVDKPFPTSLCTRLEYFLEQDTQENGRNYPDFVAISRDNSNHDEVAGKLCTVAAPSTGEGVLVLNESLGADENALHPTEFPVFLEPTYMPSKVPSSGCLECNAGDGGSCTIHRQISGADAQHKTTSYSDLIFEDYSRSVEAFSSPYPESCHLDEGRDRETLDKRKIKGKKAKQASKCIENLRQAQIQTSGKQKVSRKRKVHELCLGNSNEMEQGTKKMRGCIARKSTPYQKRLRRRKTEITRRAKAWASEAGFLKVIDKCEANEEQQESHLIISEHRRDEFVKAMVEMCRNNPRLRTSFLCSVKAIVDFGLPQLSATELLTQRSSKEAEDVIKSWEHFSNEPSSLRPAYLDFFERVDKLHRAGASIISDLSCLQAPWSCSLSATEEDRTLDVQLPKI